MNLAMAGALTISVDGLDPSLVWAAALVCALAWFTREAPRAGLDARAAYWTGVCALVGGLWGSHLLGLYVHGSTDPLAWLRIWTGGKSYYGGLIGGGLAVAACLRRRRLPLLACGDAIVPAISLGYAIGRVGCFLNGDDYGAPTHLPWAVVYPPGTEAYAAHAARGWISPGAAWSLPIHPAQLYASLLGLAMFALLANWRSKREGDRLCLFLALYGAARFSIEWLRGDFRAVFGPLSLPQLFGVLFIVVALCIWLLTHRPMARRRSAPEGLAAPPGPVVA